MWEDRPEQQASDCGAKPIGVVLSRPYTRCCGRLGCAPLSAPSQGFGHRGGVRRGNAAVDAQQVGSAAEFTQSNFRRDRRCSWGARTQCRSHLFTLHATLSPLGAQRSRQLSLGLHGTNDVALTRRRRSCAALRSPLRLSVRPFTKASALIHPHQPPIKRRPCSDLPHSSTSLSSPNLTSRTSWL